MNVNYHNINYVYYYHCICNLSCLGESDAHPQWVVKFFSVFGQIRIDLPFSPDIKIRFLRLILLLQPSSFFLYYLKHLRGLQKVYELYI